jgi:hypothetical protein
MASNLEDFFERKKVEYEKETKQVDWEGRKTEWMEAVNTLYLKILEWLAPFQEQGHLSVDYSPLILEEEYLGRYEIKKMILKFYDQQVIFEPIGSVIIGAFGRVDMIGKNGSVKILYFSSGGPKITVSSPQNGTSFSEPQEKVWKIKTEPPNVQYIDLNDESFSDAFLWLVQ